MNTQSVEHNLHRCLLLLIGTEIHCIQIDIARLEKVQSAYSVDKQNLQLVVAQADIYSIDWS